MLEDWCFLKKSYDSLFSRLDKLDRPVILEIKGNYVEFRSKIDPNSVIYWGDGSITKLREEHTYVEEKNYTIRIFGHCSKFVVPANTIDVCSIGKITDLSEMFYCCENLTTPIGANWDTTNAQKMRNVF